jgi:hypothetical protein
MPNAWTGKGNPYTRSEVLDRLRATLKAGKPIIAAGAGTGISAKFLEKGASISSSSTSTTRAGSGWPATAPTRGFIMTFSSPEARDAYRPNPEHARVKAIVVPCLARVIVLDFNMPAA